MEQILQELQQTIHELVERDGLEDLTEEQWFLYLGKSFGRVADSISEFSGPFPESANYKEKLMKLATVAILAAENYERKQGH